MREKHGCLANNNTNFFTQIKFMFSSYKKSLTRSETEKFVGWLAAPQLRHISREIIESSQIFSADAKCQVVAVE
jgi:hypothetical protein